MKLVKLTEVALKPNVVGPGKIEHTVRKVGPIWVSALGVNSVRQYLDAAATIITMDDGQNEFTVAETPRTVVFRVNKELAERD